MDKDNDNDTVSQPIQYSPYHSMSASKDDPNSCSKEFLEYLSKAGPKLSRETSNSVNTKIVKIQEERTKRELMQACNLGLSIQIAEQLFPSLLKSKQKRREEIEEILKEAASQRNQE